MNYAICNETFADWSHEKAFAFAAECGYTGIEIAPFTLVPARADDTCHIDDITDATRDTIRKAAADNGLSVVGLHWLLAKTEGFYLTTPDAQVQEGTADYMKSLARLCRELDGDILVLGSPHQRNLLPGVSLEEATGHARSVIEAALPEFEASNVTLALEPLGPAEGDFWNTAAEAIEMIEAIGSPHVQLHLDVKAMSSEPAPVADVIRASAAHVAHFHANDPNLLGPGMGEVDFLPIFAALKEINYDRWVSVEVFDYTPGAERLAQESMANMRKCVAEVA